ncbi:DoxX family protein [Tenacibaculum jejuense]|uniref:DoxX family protein n=1 Tax=Tenacibaculum jejuense TaxID=584609 RepID=A0A238UDW7_9FLAO|nr:DoxX family protein [Tenacibaculum jejuense]SNR16778.1 Probable transmembrane protein of unknown function [Tenacibaculum jejuense]
MNSDLKTPRKLLKSFLTRFTLLYFIFYIYPYGFEYIYGIERDDFSIWRKITMWFSETFLGWELNEKLLYNGIDSRYDYSRFLLIAILSIILTILWIFIESKLKKNYNTKVKSFLRIMLRYHVGFTLVLYGFGKVFMTQFGRMDVASLESTIGEYSGMSFLWTFMSHSKLYTMTTGWVEVVGGVLILFRRTTFLGSFILFIAMFNVVIIDIGYDVSVKMFAIHLFVMDVILLWYYRKVLINMFVFNKNTESKNEPILFTNVKSKQIRKFIKPVLLVAYTISLFFFTRMSLGYYKTNDNPSITGFFKVNEQRINGDSINIPNQKKWKSLLINGSSWQIGNITVQKENNSKSYYSFKADTISKEIILKNRRDSTNTFTLNYKQSNKKTFVFNGVIENDTIWFKTQRKTKEDYRLMRKVRWIRDLK